MAHRVRVYPGICASSDTIVDIFIDAVEDVAVHPLYSQREVPFQAGNGGDKQRHRSMPVHRLLNELHSHMNLEADSLASDTAEGARGAKSSRPNMQMELSQLDHSAAENVSVMSFLFFVISVEFRD